MRYFLYIPFMLPNNVRKYSEMEVSFFDFALCTSSKTIIVGSLSTSIVIIKCLPLPINSTKNCKLCNPIIRKFFILIQLSYHHVVSWISSSSTPLFPIHPCVFQCQEKKPFLLHTVTAFHLSPSPSHVLPFTQIL